MGHRNELVSGIRNKNEFHSMILSRMNAEANLLVDLREI